MGGILAKEFDKKSISARHVVRDTFNATASSTGKWLAQMIGQGTIVDIIVTQRAAGTGGTSVKATVKKVPIATGTAVAVTSTDPVVTLADGANVAVDASATSQRESSNGLAAQAATGTQPVIKSDGSQNFLKGDWLTVDWTLTGTYTGAPTVDLAVVVESKY